ncbi:hypothetical protein ABZP36_001231 [Zizania latifolia]
MARREGGNAGLRGIAVAALHKQGDARGDATGSGGDDGFVTRKEKTGFGRHWSLRRRGDLGGGARCGHHGGELSVLARALLPDERPSVKKWRMPNLARAPSPPPCLLMGHGGGCNRDGHCDVCVGEKGSGAIASRSERMGEGEEEADEEGGEKAVLDGEEMRCEQTFRMFQRGCRT